MNVIEIQNIWKKFRLYHEKHETLKDTILSRRRASYEEFWALSGIDLEVPQGQTIGIIGENGSGKSTLLKLIAGILRANKGEIRVNGKISALLELGAGFHPDLTGRENIYLNGAILQLSKREIDARFDQIVSFAELEKFIDTPVKNYSSGMYMRLGFAIAISVDPDILLIDEILAVGDEAFQSKCYDAILDFKNKGKTIVIVSHDLGAVGKFCDSAAWISGGKIAVQGSTIDVIDAYRSDVHRKEGLKAQELAEKPVQGSRWGTGEARILEVELQDGEGKTKRLFETGESMQVRLKYTADQKLDEIILGVALFSKDGAYCYGTNTKADHITIDHKSGSGTVTLRYNSLPLLSGTYLLDVAIYDSSGSHPHDYLSKTCDFKVRGGKKGEMGLFYLDHVWKVE